MHFIKINWLEDVIKSRKILSDCTAMKKVSFLHMTLPQTQQLQVVLVTGATLSFRLVGTGFSRRPVE